MKKYHVDNTKQLPTCVSLCYGIGGLDEGLERAIGKLRHVCIVEIEAVLAANVVAKMEAGQMDPCPVWSDVKTFPAHLFRDRVDWLLGGYPCTPFSLAGKRKGTKDPRHLWPYFERIIEAIRPVCCFFENVDDHLTLGFPEVYESLSRMGYIVEVGIFSAEEVGAPHERQRLFILAKLADTNRNDARSAERTISKESRSIESQAQRKERYEALGQWGWPKPSHGRQMEHTSDKRNRRIRRCIPVKDEEVNQSKKLQQEKTGNAQQPGKLEYSNEQGLQGSNGILQPGRFTNTGWPSRPGEPQQAWESPRAISREAESSMGLRVDGYNFREDFLRALGNAVVPQVAEKAAIELTKKMIE